MDQSDEIRFRADSVNLLNIVVKHRKILLITAFSVLAISAAVSFFIKPLYRATVILYPTTNVTETQSLFGIQSNAVPLFGDETATEKILQILRSDRIKNFVVVKYDLINHYGISPKARYKYTMLEMKMKKYIVSRKTLYNSVEINVLDPDPELSADIANDISRQIDTVFNLIVKEAGEKASLAISESYDYQFRRVKLLEDSLHAISAGALAAIPSLEKTSGSKSSWASVTGQYSPEYLRLMDMFQSENESLSAIRNRLTEARMAAGQVLPYTHIINEAKVPEKKALPRRSIIILASVLSSLLLMIFILAAGEMITKNE